MRKLKLYLDTSVVSHLDATDVPDKMADTQRLWQDIQNGMYEVFVSPVTVRELEACGEPKRGFLLEQLRAVKPNLLADTQEANELAEEYLRNNVLTSKSLDDCLHIAFAVVYGCDVIVSWNFKHLVNLRTISRVRVVNISNHYKEIAIVSPTIMVGEES